MTSNWATVERLIRQLGAVRVSAAAANASASFAANSAIETAIHEATEAVVATINTTDAPTINRADEALDVAAQVIGALHNEVERSRRISAEAAQLRERARELIRMAGGFPN